MELINSSQNKFVKEIVNITKKNNDKYIVEGKKFIIDINKKEDIEYYALSESFYNENDYILNMINVDKIKVFSDSVFKKFSDTKSNQGIIAILNKPKVDIDEAFKRAKVNSNIILILDDLQDPGNFGTIIRTFEAIGGSMIITTKNTVSAYNPKCVRSTAGSIYLIDIIEKQESKFIYNKVNENGYKILGTHLSGDKSLYDIDLTQKIAIVIGNEGVGMSDYFTDKADILTKIPIIGKSESLNASVATSVVLYEALRQNIFKGE